MSEYSPKMSQRLSAVDNSIWKPRQLSSVYCVIWLVDFWPITILVKYISTWSYENQVNKHFVIFRNLCNLIGWFLTNYDTR